MGSTREDSSDEDRRQTSRRRQSGAAWKDRAKEEIQQAWKETHDNFSDEISATGIWHPYTIDPRSRKCRKCLTLNLSKFGKYSRGLSHHAAGDLQLAVTKGCSLCAVLAAPLDDMKGTSEMRLDPVSSLLTYSFRSGIKSFPYVRTASFEVFKQDDTETSEQWSYRKIEPRPDSEPCVSLVQSWVDNCKKSHPKCRQNSASPFPTRLIDVSGVHPRLRSHGIQSAPYITLSHTWGGKVPFRTINANLQENEKSIDLSSLPRSFQDAIMITQLLHTRFLWIDCLCIIQDSKEDWLTECARMGDYYRGALLTISAMNSTDCYQGFLKARPVVTSAKLLENEDVYIRVRSEPRDKIFASAVINERGWTLQERLLSTRVVHYGDKEMFWECLTCSAREGSFLEQRDATDVQSLYKAEGEDFKRATFARDVDPFSPEFGAFAVWYRLIVQFSRRYLTRSSDALPAISGLASNMAKGMGYRYMAGLWEQDLDGLLWNVEKSYGKYSSQPSWSWISINGSIHYPFKYLRRKALHKDAKLVSNTLRTHASNPFGEVTGGHITIRALVIRGIQCLVRYEPGKRLRKSFHCLYIMMNENAARHHAASKHGWQYSGAGGYLDEIDTYDELDTFDWVDDKESWASSCMIQKNPRARTFTAIRIATRIGEDPAPSIGGLPKPPKDYMYFLLVQPDEQQEGLWRRVGMGWCQDIPMVPRSETTKQDSVFSGWGETNPSFSGYEFEEIRLV